MTAGEGTWQDYDYAVVRILPQVHLSTFINVGVILHVRTARYLEGRFHIHRPLFDASCPDLDLALVERYLKAYADVCKGGDGPIGMLPPSERFHWLTAPRSAVVQTSEVHAGRTDNPHQTLDSLFSQYVMGAGRG